jgi:hypothetical protein
MEFFEEVEKHAVDIEALRDLLQISALPVLCRSIDTVISDNHGSGEIYCVWGQFDISREEIKNGVRFTFPGCPHAFAWTITYHPTRNMLVVHCTIDDREEDPEFIETIREFAADWGAGLTNAFAQNT